MDYQELINESLATLFANKVRTGLAMLGVIIGIGSVIALISLGQASQSSIESRIKSLGSNLLTIRPGASTSGGIRGSSGVTTLTYDDAKAIQSSSTVTTLSFISAEYQTKNQITAGRNNTNTQIIGTTPDYVSIRNLELDYGSFLTDRHLASMSRVAVLGPQTATDLFNNPASAVGKSIRLDSQSLTIIGVTKSKGGSGFMNQDDIVYVPLTTAQKILFGVDHVSTISVSATSEDQMELAQQQITDLLLIRHKIRNASQADFSIMSQEDILGTAQQITGTFTTLLSGIAAISLVVGGIGIMNIMLVTVTERTREIGLRKALGAKRKVINAQFLLEASMITLIGGIIGVIIGVLISYFLSNSMGLPFVLSFPSVFLAFAVSATIGIIFGWYPAQKAAKLEPIDALRYE